MSTSTTSRSNGRVKALETTLASLKKRFGEGAIMRLGESPQRVDVIPTGALSLDLALGVGGIPRGRITEIYGPEASGKTTLCLHIIAEAQRTGVWRRLWTVSMRWTLVMRSALG